MSAAVREFWFKPKHHGYGAVPSHWKGWLATVAFVVVLTTFSITAMIAMRETKPVAGYLAWAAMVLGSVYWFTAFARARTDGEWAWRWKGRKYADIYAPGSTGVCGPDGCEKK